MAASASALRGQVLWECPPFEGMRRSIQDGLASLANGCSAVTMERAAPAGGGWRVALDSSILAKRGCGQVLCTAVPTNGVAAAEGSSVMDQADEIANHWMATFAANMSHEVRTPLNAIRRLRRHPQTGAVRPARREVPRRRRRYPDRRKPPLAADRRHRRSLQGRIGEPRAARGVRGLLRARRRCRQHAAPERRGREGWRSQPTCRPIFPACAPIRASCARS